MNLNLTDRVVIITGGARGIGAAITRSFAAEGAIACILGRNPDEAAALSAELAPLGQRVDSFACELTDATTIERAVGEVLARYGRIDVVVNNAGVNDGVGLTAGLDAFRLSLERNLVQAYAVVHYALPSLIAARGSIINISTKCAETGQGGTSGYAAAKGGLNALTREWALDLARHSIRVNCVIPAEVMTPQYERWISQRPDPVAAVEGIKRMIPLEGRMTTAQEIADTVVFVASDRASHTTGQLLYVDGGYVHFDRAATARPLEA